MEFESLQDDDPLKAYLRELGTVQPLTKDEESELWQQTENGGDQRALAQRRLIESKLSLVVAIAERYLSSGRPILDLIEQGNIGLMMAVDTFVESSSDDFSEYAASLIENAISKASG